MDSRGHGATNCKHGWLKIGCEEHTFKDWQELFPDIAKNHNLTTEEKTEYSAIIELFTNIGK
jgi:glucuronate isomerase